jgi:hypothetical protein
MADESFKSVFGEIRGEKNKILPKELKEAGEKTPIMFNKQFYWFAELEPEVIEQDDILEKTMEAYLANKKMMDYFASAMG